MLAWKPFKEAMQAFKLSLILSHEQAAFDRRFLFSEVQELSLYLAQVPNVIVEHEELWRLTLLGVA